MFRVFHFGLKHIEIYFSERVAMIANKVPPYTPFYSIIILFDDPAIATTILFYH